jgi:hypothetical protein
MVAFRFLGMIWKPGTDCNWLCVATWEGVGLYGRRVVVHVAEPFNLIESNQDDPDWLYGIYGSSAPPQNNQILIRAQNFEKEFLMISRGKAEE